MTELQTSVDDFKRTARGAPSGARVPIELEVEVADPFKAYRRARYREGGFFTACNDGREGWGYFGIRPTRRLESTPLPTDDEVDSFAELREQVAEEDLARGDCEVPYPCAYVGWLSYDIMREKHDIEEQTVEHRHLPRVQFGVYDTIVSWREPRDGSTTLRVTSCPRIDAEAGRDVPEETAREEIYERGVARAEHVAERIANGDPATGPAPTETGLIPFESYTGKDDHIRQVERIKEYVGRGEAKRVEASHHLVAPAGAHSVEVFDSLREINPAPLLSLVEFPGVDLVSANMQLLLEIDGETARNRYYGGTHPRGETEEEDERSLRTLTSAGKYGDEHEPLADLVRADLRDICDPDTVEVVGAGEAESFSEIHHLVGRAEGRLREDVNPVDAVRSVVPGPLAGGPDKGKAARILEEVQQTRRGPYCGAIAMFGMDGDARAGTNVRTLVRYEDEYYLGVGGGNIESSVPEYEFAETINKARALVNAVDAATGEDVDVTIAEEFEQKPIVRE